MGAVKDRQKDYNKGNVISLFSIYHTMHVLSALAFISGRDIGSNVNDYPENILNNKQTVGN